MRWDSALGVNVWRGCGTEVLGCEVVLSIVNWFLTRINKCEISLGSRGWFQVREGGGDLDAFEPEECLCFLSVRLGCVLWLCVRAIYVLYPSSGSGAAIT